MRNASVALALLCALAPASAHAVCSCMFRMPRPTTRVETERIEPKAPAAAVFVARSGTRTVLTMETVYEGPPTELAMVVPVPTAVGRDEVRTVTGTLFRNLERRTGPTLRHVFPPCRRRRPRRATAAGMGSSGGGGGGAPPPPGEIEDLGVEIEDEWEVEEYDVSRLSASQSTGLLTFLRDRGLALPDRAAEVLRAYIETGHRFLFVQVDPTRAHEDEGRMLLSPIQVEYDSDELRVPVRLGTLNSPGKQDLLLFVLSDEGRYEIANREMLVAPSNLALDAGARGRVAELYESITDEIFRQHPGAAVTELAAPIGSRVGARHVRRLGYPEDARRGRWTLTRIRHRYGPELDDDLTLRPAPPLRLSGRVGRQAEVAERGTNNFQIRYVRRHGSNAARCNAALQQRIAASWGTRLPRRTEAEGPLWPGSVVRSRIELLGIEPGSERPPPEPEPMPEPAAEVAPPAPPPAPPTPAPPAAAPPPTPRSEPEGGLCAIGQRGAPGPWWLGSLVALGVYGARRRRRGRRAQGG